MLQVKIELKLQCNQHRKDMVEKQMFEYVSSSNLDYGHLCFVLILSPPKLFHWACGLNMKLMRKFTIIAISACLTLVKIVASHKKIIVH